MHTYGSKFPSNMCPLCYLPTQIQVTTFRPFTPARNISKEFWRRISVWPFTKQQKRYRRGEDGSHGRRKTIGSTVIYLSNNAGDARTYTVTSGRYHKKIFLGVSDMAIKFPEQTLNTWCAVSKTLWMVFVVILKQTFMNKQKFNFNQGGGGVLLEAKYNNL